VSRCHLFFEKFLQRSFRRAAGLVLAFIFLLYLHY
jgi:hypothetical protein